MCCVFFQAEDGIRDLVRSRGLGDVYKRQETDISVSYDDELLEKLAKSNCVQVLIGFETSTAKGLKNLDKANWKYKQFDNYYKAIEKIQSYGISVNGLALIHISEPTRPY